MADAFLLLLLTPFSPWQDFNGSIDNFRIYGYALNMSQIQSLASI